MYHSLRSRFGPRGLGSRSCHSEGTDSGHTSHVKSRGYGETQVLTDAGGEKGGRVRDTG